MMPTAIPQRIFCTLLASILLLAGLSAQASVSDETTQITLNQSVYFIGTDGSVVVATPGNYFVENTQEWLRFIPGTNRQDALLVVAQKETHEVKVEIPIVLSTSGSEPNERDLHIVQYLNPDGTGLVATGTYSGIQPRGIFDAAKTAAARARTAAERARRAAATRRAQNRENAAKLRALMAKMAAEYPEEEKEIIKMMMESRNQSIEQILKMMQQSRAAQLKIQQAGKGR